MCEWQIQSQPNVKIYHWMCLQAWQQSWIGNLNSRVEHLTEISPSLQYSTSWSISLLIYCLSKGLNLIYIYIIFFVLKRRYFRPAEKLATLLLLPNGYARNNNFFWVLISTIHVGTVYNSFPFFPPVICLFYLFFQKWISMDKMKSITL